ncbi:7-cyano-7-deazaguanine synthase [Roseivirga thermotolerans]|uniref:7-cyano-7-deazaguanine synthase n=1 Tax=Roseivirga thermotolerans TaxID=1758176 RepID=A0ABQ3I8Z0_9BACT|nr:7-cyano-7-deazaguanine synthase [Roseivirga thermotolerans]GHE74573.1 7-cyano-7-deazaguanine synthase [Roseivirga thermotolerans]
MDETIQLLSGGVDSTACIQFFKSEGFKIRPLFIDYGQPAALKEREACEWVCDYFNLNLEIIYISSLGSFSSGLIDGRNLFLLSLAIMKSSAKTKYISIGIHSGTDYLDCSENFISKFQDTLDSSLNSNIRVLAPFISWRKHQIWQYLKSTNISFQNLVSCEIGTDVPCGQCPSCLERIFLESHEK